MRSEKFNFVISELENLKVDFLIKDDGSIEIDTWQGLGFYNPDSGRYHFGHVLGTLRDPYYFPNMLRDQIGIKRNSSVVHQKALREHIVGGLGA